MRRSVAALLVGVAGAVAFTAFRPEPPPEGVPVLVAAHDLPTGTRLTSEDVRVATWPADVSPPRTAASVGAVVGEVVNAPVAAGGPLPRLRLRTTALLRALPDGDVAVHVPLRDPAIRRFLQPGDRVDALSAAGGDTVAGGLLVLATGSGNGSPPAAAPGGAAATVATEGGVLVAATPQQASSLAATIAEDGPGAGVVLSILSRG
ncbi:MAG TPA: SAF domain-containing protein [Segeticoccus sp.]|nr:SAF domain-containing protein [Segeticoccus sp.]